jgi:integrase
VSHAEIQQWVSSLTAERSASTAVKSHRLLSLVLSLAVRDGRLARNPAVDIKLPREAEKDRRYLTHTEVRRLAIAAGRHRLVVLFLAYTGMRFGEVAALRVRRVDIDTRRIEVAESVTSVNGVLVWGTPKNHARRRLSVPRFVFDDLKKHIEGRAADELVFASPEGQVLRGQLPS